MTGNPSPPSGIGRLGVAIAVAALLALAAGPRPAAALELLETFDSSPGAADSGLRGMLLDGSEHPWRGGFKDGAYVLSNSSTPNAVKYFHFGTMRGARPKLVAVKVSGAFDGDSSGAGLLYRYDAASGTYFAFVMSRDGRYTLYKRGSGGLRPLLAGSDDGIDPAGAAHLRVELEGTAATLFVNDKKVGAHDSSGPPDGPEAGMIAISSGTFRFDDFRLITE